MQTYHLLIIDSDKHYLESLSEPLSSDYKIELATDFLSAKELLSGEINFDVVLVNNDLCHGDESIWLKSVQIDENKNYVLVLYAENITETSLLNGFECGVDDFISKSISASIFNHRIEKLINNKKRVDEFKCELASKDNVINVSMTQASKYGTCMQLTSKLNNCFTYEAIKEEVFKYFYSMNLRGCIAFYPLAQQPHFYSAQTGLCSPMEIDVMKLLKVKPRLYRFGTRTIFNHQLVSILILNMEEGTIETDIYIDALASVIECLGARMAFIMYKESLSLVQEQIKLAVNSTKKLMDDSKKNQKEVMDEIVAKLGMSFHVLDMTMEQEEYLTSLVNDTLKKHNQSDGDFEEVTHLLDQALKSVDSLESLDVVHESEECVEDFDEEDELF